MPVPHSDKTVCIDPLITKFCFERASLPFRMPPDRRASADGGIVMLDLTCAGGRDELGQGFTPDAGKREVDDVGVAEEVIQKRFDRFQRVGSTELKENYPHTPCCARHFPRIPRTEECTPNRARESMAECANRVRVGDKCRILKKTSSPCKLISMPELPDIAAYITALEPRIVGQPVQRIRLASPFLLRTVQPPLASAEGQTVKRLRRSGSRTA